MTEFILLAVVLLVPLTFASAEVYRIWAISESVRSAAGEAARAFESGHDERSAGQRARAAARLATSSAPGVQGGVDVHWRCSKRPCLSPGSRIAVTVAARASPSSVPLVGRMGARTISGTEIAIIDDFRGLP